MSQPFVRPDVAAFLAAIAASGMPPINALPVAEARAAVRARTATNDIEPLALPVVRELACPGPGGRIALRLYDRRSTRGAGPVILYFHGGGFVFGDLDTHDRLCRTLAARADLPVLAVDYRLAPEHPFPAFVEDAEAVARWLAGRPAGLGVLPSGIVTCGDSAGAHLAILVAQRLGQDPAPLPVLAQWAIYPFLGGGEDWESVRTLGEGYLLTRAAMSWFDALCGNPYGDPRYTLLRGPVPVTPLLVQTASLDPLRDQGVAYGELARAAGARVTHIEAQGMIHGFAVMRRALPSAEADVKACISAGLELLAEA